MADEPSLAAHSIPPVVRQKAWTWHVVLRLAIVAAFAQQFVSDWNWNDSRTGVAYVLGGAAFLLLPNAVLAAGFLYGQRWSYVLAALSDCTFAAFLFGIEVGLNPVEQVSVRYCVNVLVFGALVLEGSSLVSRWGKRFGYRISYWIVSALCFGAGFTISHMFGVLD